MKFNYKFITLIAISCGLLLLYSCNEADGLMEPDNEPVRHELACLQIDNVWKIVDAQDTTETEITVARGDTVVWWAPQDRDLFFQFMDDNLTGIFTRELSQGESLSLVIGRDAEAGDNPYAVFVYEAREYAVGESPPRMIVRE